jgi:hypothetical protein
MAKVFMALVAFFFLTLAVVTSIETVTRPTASVAAETRADRRKRTR